jgi:hypothetical protein
MARPLFLFVSGLTVGLVVSGGTWLAFGRSTATPAYAASATSEGAPPPESPYAEANAKLVASLGECNRKLAYHDDHGSSPPPGPPPGMAPERPPGFPDGGRPINREPTKEDWERFARSAAFPVSIPCIREKVWTPPPPIVTQLGLAPADVEAIHEAYEKSNKRMTSVIMPLCAKELGSADVANRVGVTTCLDAVLNSSRQTNAAGFKESVEHVAELHAGKREETKAAAGAEQLLLALTRESQAFEKDLAEKVGPEDAKRMKQVLDYCSDRRFVRGGAL